MAAGAPCRPCDALYDPTATFSGARDFYRQQGAGFVLEKVPDYANFFSELAHHPSASVRLKPGDRVPRWVDRTWGGRTAGATTAAQRTQPAVGGRQAFKFHSQPLPPPGGDAAAARLATQLAAVRFAVRPPAAPENTPPEPWVKEAGTQSDFRESEVQTLPWSPDCKGLPAPQPATTASGLEVLALQNLRWGAGLPGGLEEVQRLEALRRKRVFEATLPPIDDVGRLPLRQAMVEQWDLGEWEQRAEEIRGVQEQRLILLEQALQAREADIEAHHEHQVGARTAGQRAEKASKLAAIHAARVRTVRQLTARMELAASAAIMGASSMRPACCSAGDRAGSRHDDPVARYADYGSTVYAPLQREGRFPDNTVSSEPVDLDGLTAQAPLQRLQWLNGLESFLPRSYAKGTSGQSKPRRKVPAGQPTYQERQEAARHADVLRLAAILADAKAGAMRRASGAGGEKAAACLAGMPGQDATGRGEPCELEGVPVGGMWVEGGGAAADGVGPASGSSTTAAAALVLLQRLLRGRVAQEDTLSGLSSCAALIQELRLGLDNHSGYAARPEEVALEQIFGVDAGVGHALCTACCQIHGGEGGLLLGGLSPPTQSRDQAMIPDSATPVTADTLVEAAADFPWPAGVHMAAPSSAQNVAAASSAAGAGRQLSTEGLLAGTITTGVVSSSGSDTMCVAAREAGAKLEVPQAAISNDPASACERLPQPEPEWSSTSGE